METTTAVTQRFYSWVNAYTSRKINIGPINESLIKLFEDVEKIKVPENIKQEILENNL